MLLTCPTCRSGLQVPDGTTAHVRCPACRTIFTPAEGLNPPPLPPAPPPAPPKPTAAPPKAPAKPARSKPAPRPRDEEDEKRKKADGEPGYDDEEEDEERARKRRRRPEEDDGLTPEERRARTAAFQRGMWGAKLLWISLLLYCFSLMLIGLFFIATSVADPEPAIIVAAGALGLINWLLGAVGIGLCISSRPSPGHYGFGIAAAIAAFVHLILLVVVVSRAEPFVVNRAVDESAVKWFQLPTQLNNLTLYLTYVVYSDEFPPQHRPRVVLSLITGGVEMARLILLMMLLSCLARAAGDEELAHRCTRAAGVATFGPGVITLGLFLLFAMLIETGGRESTIGKVLLVVSLLSVYMLIAMMLVPSLTATRDVAEACEFPFQSQRTDLLP